MLRECVDGSVEGDLLYASDLYEHSTMKRFAEQFETLATSVVTKPYEGTLGTYAILPSHEIEKLQVTWNQTVEVDFPKPERIEILFECAAEKYGTHVAIEESQGEKRCTYRELVSLSDKLASCIAPVQP